MTNVETSNNGALTKKENMEAKETMSADYRVHLYSFILLAMANHFSILMRVIGRKHLAEGWCL